jgi:hypothetical protein
MAATATEIVEAMKRMAALVEAMTRKRVARIARYASYANTEIVPPLVSVLFFLVSVLFFLMFFQFYAPGNNGPATAMQGAVLNLPCTEDDSWRMVNFFWQGLAKYDTLRSVFWVGNFVAFAGWAFDTATDGAKFADWVDKRRFGGAGARIVQGVQDFFTRTANSCPLFRRASGVVQKLCNLGYLAYFVDGKFCLVGTGVVQVVTHVPGVFPVVFKLAANLLDRSFSLAAPLSVALVLVFVGYNHKFFQSQLCRSRSTVAEFFQFFHALMIAHTGRHS